MRQFFKCFFFFFLPLQSKLGLAALVVATLHTLTFGWKRAFEANRYKFYLPPTFTLTLILPLIVLLARSAFLLPCLHTKLARIRRGWEKNTSARFSHLSDTSTESSSNV